MSTQQQRFEAERRRQLGRLAKITQATRDRVLNALLRAQRTIQQQIAQARSDWQLARSQRVLVAVDAALAAFRKGGDAAWQQGVGQAFSAGIDLVDKPLSAAGVALAGTDRVDSRQLLAIRSFLTDRISSISDEARKAIAAQLELVITGAQSGSDATKAIEAILGGNARTRAITITRTELGRAYALASYEAMIAKKQLLPGLKKQWRKSGKLHPRETHVAVDGQIREVEEPFDVDEEDLRFPRDPNASAKNTINCGCTMLPHMSSWEMSSPGRKVQPMTHLERLAQAKKTPERTPTPVFPRGLAGLPEPVKDVLRRFEPSMTRLKDRERAVVVDQFGNVLFDRFGGKSSVRFSPDELDTMRAAPGVVLTHNHPGGSAFSIEDLRFAVSQSLAEIRAVSARTLYRMRPGAEGWAALGALLADWSHIRQLIVAAQSAAQQEAIRYNMTAEQRDLAAHLALIQSIARRAGVRFWAVSRKSS